MTKKNTSQIVVLVARDEKGEVLRDKNKKPIVKTIAAGLFFNHARLLHMSQFPADSVNFFSGPTNQISNVINFRRIIKEYLQKFYPNL